MADPVPAADDQIVDEARAAAAGIRTTARWLAGALGAIPGLALVTTLVTGPGDAGFREGRLWLGVGLAALGAFVGVTSFANLLAPIPLTDKDLQTADLTSIPGSGRARFSDLAGDIEAARSASAQREGELSELEASAKKAEVEAAQSDAYATKLEAAVKDGNKALEGPAKEARERAREKQLAHEVAAGKFAAASARSKFLFEQLERAKTVRHEAYLLKAGEILGKKFDNAQVGVLASLALVAVGVGFLAVAPKPKATAEAAAPVSLVTLRPNHDGKIKLGCQEASVSALKIGGTKDAPKVITYPTGACQSRVIVFRKVEPKPLGDVEEVKETEAGK